MLQTYSQRKISNNIINSACVTCVVTFKYNTDIIQSRIIMIVHDNQNNHPYTP